MNQSFLLTTEERERFALWLDRQAESSKGIIEQMKKLPHLAAVIDKEKQELLAYIVVAKVLRSIESVEVEA